MDKIEGLYVVVLHWNAELSDEYGPYVYEEAVEEYSIHLRELQDEPSVKVKIAKLTFLD